MISFDIGHSGQSLTFDDGVLAHFQRHKQIRFWQREAGGLLFARMNLPVISVCRITGPRFGDRRSRYSYRPDERAEQREIEKMFRDDFHFVGCWHTHPEDFASPSKLDTRNISDCVRRSQHALNGFVMVIVGRAKFPDSLFVSVCDASDVHPLRVASIKSTSAIVLAPVPELRPSSSASAYPHLNFNFREGS
ncbi:Mov34/MPN/PAD-1 family protein [Bradyrhizobium lablabi]|uniref:Mov34/MPN/PAD-1 family protein n=1 Tax=Bradyrhizobium lablabi TaxID=722472 RepID=UPI0007C6E607|nr:Mov34/MPN/PAD-1 family protein [Bradyrhizobium lablabi]